MTGRLVEKSAASVARKKLLAEAGYRTGMRGLVDGLNAGRRATGDFYLSGRRLALQSNAKGAQIRRNAALGKSLSKAVQTHSRAESVAYHGAAGMGLTALPIALSRHAGTKTGVKIMAGGAGFGAAYGALKPVTHPKKKRPVEPEVKKARVDAFLKADSGTLATAGVLGGAGYGAYKVGAARERKLISDGVRPLPKPVTAAPVAVAPGTTVLPPRGGKRRKAPAGTNYARHAKPGRLIRAVGALR